MVVIRLMLVNRPAALTQKRFFYYDCRKGRGLSDVETADHKAGRGRP
jgi:hypothetical protein